MLKEVDSTLLHSVIHTRNNKRNKSRSAFIGDRTTGLKQSSEFESHLNPALGRVHLNMSRKVPDCEPRQPFEIFISQRGSGGVLPNVVTAEA